jgi:hemoglobin
VLILSAFVLAPASLGDAWGQEPRSPAQVDTREIDAAIHKTLRTVINQGADLFNSGDWAGCYRLYEGALMAYRPILGHHPDLQQTIDTALVEAARSPVVNDRAFVLRKAIDKVRADLHKSSTVVTPPPPPKTLWERLGNEAGVRKIVDDFIDASIKDPKVNFFRDPKYVPQREQMLTLKTKVVELISSLTGGPLQYRGLSMKDAHRGMGITNAEFDAFAGHVRAALQNAKVKPDDEKVLMSAIHNMRKDIVGMKAEEKKEEKKKGNELLPPPKEGAANPGNEFLPAPKPAARVTGTVTLNGQPLPVGNVVFTAQDGKSSVNGTIRPDGTYQVETVATGKLKVHFTVPIGAGPKPNEKVIPIPAKYTRADTSGIMVELKQGENHCDFDLSTR